MVALMRWVCIGAWWYGGFEVDVMRNGCVGVWRGSAALQPGVGAEVSGALAQGSCARAAGGAAE
eukprot:3568979-Rhodomonas_salina.3